MDTLWLPLLYLFVPFLLLFFMACEVYIRNPRHKLHRLTAALLLLLSSLMLAAYLAMVTPISFASLIYRTWYYPVSFVVMTLVIYFFEILAKMSMLSVRDHIVSLFPLIGDLFLYAHPSWIWVTVQQHALWRSQTLSRGLTILIVGICIYTMVVLSNLFVRSYIKIQSKSLHLRIAGRRMRIILYGSIAACLWAIIFTIVSFMKGADNVSIVPMDILPAYSVVVWALVLRYAMVKFDFLASANRRYELLFSMSRHGIALMSDDFRILESNSTFVDLAGVETDARRPFHLNSLFMKSNRPEAVEQFQTAFKQLSPLSMELQIVNIKGKMLCVEMESDFFEMNDDICCLLIIRDVTLQKDNEAKLRYLAYHDPLTSLPNRIQFNDKLIQLIIEAEQSHQQTAVLLLDLDHFKWINDTHGHSAGDIVLCHVASQLLRGVPSRGMAARLGGDEFVICMPIRHSEDEAIDYAENLLRSLIQPISIHEKLYHITGSLGISIAPRDGDTVEMLIRNSDTAMYAAKSKGRNRYHVFSPVLEEIVKRHLDVSSGLSVALDSNEFFVNYQPQYDLLSHHIVGVEALLRWRSNELGMVSPEEFIPIAESTGVIIPIGEWVLRTAMQQAKLWSNQGHVNILVSVNLSVVQLCDPNFVSILSVLLQETQLNPNRLCLEITETAAMLDVDQALAVCKQLVGLGVSLAIDDFGTGYSSLSVLNQFPFHFVKIDRSLIADIAHSSRELEIIQTIVHLATALHMQTVAEGIESEVQWAILENAGCDIGQGYYSGRPVAADKITDLLNREARTPFSSH